jgi:adenylate cyclase
MSLRMKTLLIMAFTSAALLLVMTLSLRSILSDSFRTIENQDAEKNQDRALNALKESFEAIDRASQDYGYWDSLYEFMATRDPNFTDVDFSVSTYENLRWSLVIIFDEKGQKVYQGAYDLDKNQTMSVSEDWSHAIDSRLDRLKPLGLESAVSGLIPLPEGIMFLMVRDILTSDRSGPARGRFITGRLLTPREERKLAEQTKLDLRLRAGHLDQKSDHERALVDSMAPGQKRLVKAIDEQQLVAIERISDFDNKTALYLTLYLPRVIHQQGQKSLSYLVTAMVLCGLVFAGVISWLIERHVISRMLHLTKEVLELRDSHDFSRRLTAIGKDEIGILSQSINGLLHAHEGLNVLLEVEKAKSDRVLHNVLPDQIASRLKESNGIIAESFPEVTILFADIVDFTSMSSKISPEHLVNLLNEVFSAFDRLAEKHGLEKIKTIGDAYMVVGGLPHHRDDHAEATARMALDMLTTLEQISQKRGQKLEIRIGINTGPVVAGVIGTKKFLYDLWGDTVNTASRMESSGTAGWIQVTESTYSQVKNCFQLQALGQKDIKGKGYIPVYRLLREEPKQNAA